MKKVLLLFMVLAVSVGLAQAQNRTVSGVVTDAETGSPLPLANVQIKGTTTGTVTDNDGRFTLQVSGEEAILVFFYTGYQTQEIPVAGQTTFNVALKSANEEIDQVVVVGYGTTTKKAFTGAASSVGDEAMQNKVSTNPIKALEATVPGLQMSSSSGQPGAPVGVYIRGFNSINSSTAPLYVIDGVPFETSAVSTRSNEGVDLSPLAALNPDDIASYTVLKDATATAIYGARAANGVIVITTKKGKKGGLSINFSAKLGAELLPPVPRNYRLLNTEEYMEMYMEGFKNSVPMYWDDVNYELGGKHHVPTVEDILGNQDALYDYIDLFEGLYWSGSTFNEKGVRGWRDVNTNWLKEITRPGFVQNYSLSVMGGGESETAATHYMSVEYLDNKAYMRGKDLNRISFRYNMDQQPWRIFKYGINFSVAQTTSNMGAGGGYFSDPLTQAYMIVPVVPVKDAKGEWNFDNNTGYNPVAQRSEKGDKNTMKMRRFVAIPYVQFNILPQLVFQSKFGLDALLQQEFGYWSFYGQQGRDMNGMGEMTNYNRFMMTWTNTLAYRQTFVEAHTLNALFGYEAQRMQDDNAYLAASNYPVDYLNSVSLASKPSDATTQKAALGMQSLFVNVEYDYMNRYYLSGSLRFDGSSRFHPSKYWAPFWSVGAKWRIAEEAFMAPAQKWLNELTLRTSYGTTGNQSVGSGWYAWQDLYGFGYNYNGRGGSKREQMENRDLSWEQTNKWNLGLDLAFFYRLNISVDWYYHLTKDMVFAMPLSRATGFSSIYKNIGLMRNQGLEFSINAHAVKMENFNWHLTLVGSHNENKIKKLSTNKPIKQNLTIREVGHDYFTWRMFKYAGVDPQTGERQWYDKDGNIEKNYNRLAAKDENKYYVGTATPKFQGSLTSSMDFYGVDFSFQFSTMLGHMIYGDHLRYDEQIGGTMPSNMTHWVYDRRWKKPGDVTDVPKFVYGGDANKSSTQFLMKGNYLKLQSVTLGYTLPKAWTDKMMMKSFRIFATAENLYTFKSRKYRGFNPADVPLSGVQWWNYPAPLTIIGGLTVGF